MDKEKEEKMYIGTLLYAVNGGMPMPYGTTYISRPGETMEQVAALLENAREAAIKQNRGMNYTYYGFLGELTHQIAPPPLPKPVPVSKIETLPFAVAGRKVAGVAGLKKALKTITTGQ